MEVKKLIESFDDNPKTHIYTEEKLKEIRKACNGTPITIRLLYLALFICTTILLPHIILESNYSTAELADSKIYHVLDAIIKNPVLIFCVVFISFPFILIGGTSYIIPGHNPFEYTELTIEDFRATYNKALEGDLESIKRMADFYKKNKFVDKNLKKCIAYYAISSDMNDIESTCNLVDYYRYRDEDKHYQLLLKGKEQGSVKCAKELSDLLGENDKKESNCSSIAAPLIIGALFGITLF